MAAAVKRVRILDADPGLGDGLTSEQVALARSTLMVSLRRLDAGICDLASDDVPLVGFVVVSGCITRELTVLGDVAAIEFLAEGDLFRPTQEASLTSVESRVVWRVLEATTLAVLDGEFLRSLQPWPEVTAALFARQERRAEWLSSVLAISHLPGIDTRVLALFWQFADRWGRVHGDQVRVSIPLTHLNIARLVGARRPTVTTALHRLAETDLVMQDGNGHWLLRGGPPRDPRDVGSGALRGAPTGVAER